MAAMRRLLGSSRIIATVLAGAAVVAGCSAGAASPAPYSSPSGTIDPNPTNPPWFDVAMTDVNSGRQFKIADFRGKVVLVETMATWCPSCQGEMSQVRDVIAALGPDADFVAVSLDVDTNEDATILKKYTTLNNFDWRIAVAPLEVSRFLAKNYDVNYINPPLQPMLLIDRQGGVWGLPFGQKSSISLKKTIDKYLASE